MAEIAPAGGGPNRLFVVIALGLVALLLIGLIAVGGILFIPRLLGSASAPTRPAVATTPTRIQVAQATEAPTDTDTPPATSTLVVSTSAPEASALTATSPITGTPGAGGTLPQSGLGEDLVLLAGGIVLVLIIFAARRARSITPA